MGAKSRKVSRGASSKSDIRRFPVPGTVSLFDGRKGVVPLLIVFAAGWLVYWNSLSVPFLFDDLEAICRNLRIRQLWPPWDALSPPPELPVTNRPLLQLSFAVNYAISGLGVRSYHATNILIHSLAGLALFGVVHRTLLLRTMKPRFGDAAASLAMFTALLWTVHPLNTGSVTYIVQRAESLMGLFFLTTLYCVVRGAELTYPGNGAASQPVSHSTPSQCRRSGRRLAAFPILWYVIAYAVFILGLMTKEVMITAPVVILLYDRTFLAGSWKSAIRNRLWLYVAFATACIPFALISIRAHPESAGFQQGAFTPLLYAQVQLGVVTDYIRLAFWPAPLLLDYWVPIPHRIEEVVVPGMFIGMLLTMTIIAVVKWPAAGCAAACFFIVLSPTSSFFPIITESAAEHRMYLPLASIIALTVSGAYRGSEWIIEGTDIAASLVRGCRLAAVCLLVVVLSTLTVKRNQDYRSAETIWTDTVEKSPSNPRAHYNLAGIMRTSNRPQEAIEHYEKTLQSLPNLADAHSFLGMLEGQQGQFRKAYDHFEKAVKLDPELIDARNNYGAILAGDGRTTEAISQYLEALKIDPKSVITHVNLGDSYQSSGKLAAAISHYNEALALDPNNMYAHFGLGCLLRRKGDIGNARRHLETVLRINPQMIAARRELSRL